MKIEDLMIAAIGRDRAWRLARRVYMRARGEKFANEIGTNGERQLIEDVVRSVAPQRSPILFDIGANNGEWSHNALDIATSLAIPLSLYLFEAAPDAAANLRRQFGGRTDAVVHELAMSDRIGSARFAVVDQTAGTNSLELDSIDGDAKQIDVAVSTGEAVANRLALDHIDLVKIDTEGHDFNVIAGFESMIAKAKIGVVQFEYNSRWLSARRSLRDVFALADRHGYRVGRVGPAGIELFDAWNPECDRFFEDNYVLVSPSFARAAFVCPTIWTVENTLRASTKIGF